MASTEPEVSISQEASTGNTYLSSNRGKSDPAWHRPGYKGPNYYRVRGHFLNKWVEDMKKLVNDFQSIWKRTGCTLMEDGWSDCSRRTLISFLVYCPKGTVFIKSVDASHASKTADLLFKLFKEVVMYVGSENIVHIVTDNAAIYVVVGRLLERVPSPVLFTHEKEIVRPNTTRFATNFIVSQSILAQKDELRAHVTSREWASSTYSKYGKAKKCVEQVLDSNFWKQYADIVKIIEALVRVLHIVDSEDKPAMCFLYQIPVCVQRLRHPMVHLWTALASLWALGSRHMEQMWAYTWERETHWMLAFVFHLDPTLEMLEHELESGPHG
ncbi:PREDICTED: uncharacterized protein LOC109353948 [Lupinus angustifolius]|uniref:uncharacterized protein LOC109353948 n=1 Tax=Lupinus angustifolius TaxID=3871 RepID=UPI00092EF402|nr:PREDICTED: uncharacterized protein LOC109353948 [Lupinus angustifolius]